MVFAASALRWARLLTSSATTANPFPASPARAASTAAFRARRFVWKAISSIVFRIFAVWSEDSLIRPMASFMRITEAWLFRAASLAPSAMVFACLALSAFCFVIAVISCIDDDVSSRLEACSLAPSRAPGSTGRADRRPRTPAPPPWRDLPPRSGASGRCPG